MALAVIGIVISVALIVGIWMGRGAVNSELASISAGIDGRLQRVDAALDQLSRRLERAQGRVDGASTVAMKLGEGPVADGPLADALRETTDQLADDYADMRDSFATAREGINAASDLLDWVRQRFPMLPIPRLPGDLVQALDQRLTELNASVTQLRTELSTRQGPVERLGDRVGAALNNVATKIGEVASQVRSVQARINDARTTLVETQATAERWVTVGAILASLFNLYGILVNLCLFVVARAWFRPPSAMPAAA
jgi:methyl-accepting chemotaxis protein